MGFIWILKEFVITLISSVLIPFHSKTPCCSKFGNSVIYKLKEAIYMNIKRILFFLLVMVFLLCSVPGTAMNPAAFGAFSAENLRGEDGEPITEAIFAEAEITLLNFWATWCGPCVSELPELGKLGELSEGRAQVVGVLLDGLKAKGERDEAVLAAMHQLLDRAEAAFPVILPDEWLMQVASLVTAIPTTFLVNSEGVILTTVVGARSAEQWLAVIDEALAKE